MQRDLYDLPRDMARFRAYLDTMTDPVTKDLKYPLVAMNPIGNRAAYIERHLDATDQPTLITCLFGDEAGATLGYPRLGFSTRAGLALALADASRESERVSR